MLLKVFLTLCTYNKLSKCCEKSFLGGLPGGLWAAYEGNSGQLMLLLQWKAGQSLPSGIFIGYLHHNRISPHNIYTSLVSKNIFQEYYTLVVIIARKTPLGAHIVHRTHCTLVRKWEYFHNGQNISLSTICNLSLTSRVWMSENLDSRQYPTYCWKPHYFECVLWWHDKQKTICLI